MHIERIRGSAVLIAGGLTLAGCQSYEPRPLDLDAHRAEWLERSPASERVAAFARRLSEDPVAHAAFDPSDGVSLAEAEVIAIVFNPDLRLARARADIAAATAEHAGLWEDPEFQIDALYVTESVPNPWVVTPGIAFTIPISGRLEVEKARADAALRAELDRIAEAEWQTRYDLRRAWLGWSAETIRVEESERLVTGMDSLVGSTGRLAQAGEMVRTEAALFAIEQTQRRHDLRRFRGAVAESEQRIRAIMGLSPDAPLVLEPSVGIDDAMHDGALDPADRNPTLARLRDEYDVAEETLHREIRKQYPDLTIGPQYESDQGQSKIGLIGAIPLPVLNANRQGIAEAEAEREFARATFETTYERLAGALALARVRASTLAGRRDDIATVLGPLVDRQLDDARRLLEIGEGGGLVLLESVSLSYETKLELIDVQLAQALTSAEIGFLIGPEPPPATPDLEGQATGTGREAQP